MGCALDCKKCAGKPSTSDKWRYTLMTTVIFLIVVNPMTYKLTNKLFSKFLGSVASPSSGCPSTIGILLHAVVFTLLLRYVMDLDI
jgi:hypothetical protein